MRNDKEDIMVSMDCCHLAWEYCLPAAVLLLLDLPLGGHNLLSQRGKEEGMVEVGIEHLTNKIVGGSIDQVDLDGGVEGLNIHQTEGKKPPFGSSIVGTRARRGVEIGIV